MIRMTFDDALTNRPHNFIDGAFRASEGGARRELINPYTEQVMGSVTLGTGADVDAAVRAARAAFPAWAAMPRDERAGWFLKLAGALNARAETIAALESAEMGSPIGFSKLAQTQLPIAILASHAALLQEGPHRELIGNSRVVREPVGVVGAIAAWNYPLLLLFGKIAPAIATGCTVVAKPSEFSPLTAMILADVMAETGFPKGVINIVNGTGPEVGEAIVAHPDIDMITYTGSTAVGRRVMAVAAGTIKKLSLELGGKSATVVLDDAPLEKAVRGAVQGCFINSGQTCIALTRLIVPTAKQDEALQIAADEAAKFIPGDPMLPTTTLGPMAYAGHRTRVQDYIRVGVSEGARLVTGGPEAPGGLNHGYFVQPTVFGNVRPDMHIAQEEIFGPVLSVIPATSEAEAIEIANGTIYGLNGAVWSADVEHATRVGRALRCGKVDINGGGFNMHAPAGGFKQSGIGRERGRYAMEEFMEIKAIQFNTEALAEASAAE
jgi:aldehyde dehydrogenase (NAD+)